MTQIPIRTQTNSGSDKGGKDKRVRPIVVIPVHRSNPNGDELFVLKQIGKVLGGHELRLICPKSLDVRSYLEVVPTLGITRMSDHHFGNVLEYNRLRKNTKLYKKFTGYTHILFHELDAFVFKDELLYWCQQNVDYIGAPWVYRTNDARCLLHKGVGNSGFSLVHVDHTIRSLEKLNLSAGRTTVAQRASLMKLGRHHKLVRTEINVDVFFSFLAENDPEFTVASFDQAVKFSFELCPAELFEYCQNELPFGCHAWGQYDRDFWIPIMNLFGLGKKQISFRKRAQKPMSPGKKIFYLKEKSIISLNGNAHSTNKESG